jgi:hypothetical protein
MGVAGQPFVMRIHNDAGFIVLPHTHVEDENIAVVKGIWSLGMGNEFSSSGLSSATVGDYLCQAVAPLLQYPSFFCQPGENAVHRHIAIGLGMVASAGFGAAAVQTLHA